MKIVEFFTSNNKEHWLSEIEKCDWGAGQYLHQLLKEKNLKNMVGEAAIVPMLVDGDELVAFCTFAPLDDIQPTDLSPWIGFVYTFPKYRGHHYAGQLLDYAESIATVMGREYVYIPSGHTGLYEKYGYEFYRMDKDIEGGDSRVYRKALAVEGPDKDRRYENGANACKAQAMFIRKYGKEKFFQVHDKLHETYSFEKTQEILGQDVQEGFKILEKCATLIR